MWPLNSSATYEIQISCFFLSEPWPTRLVPEISVPGHALYWHWKIPCNRARQLRLVLPVTDRKTNWQTDYSATVSPLGPLSCNPHCAKTLFAPILKPKNPCSAKTLVILNGYSWCLSPLCFALPTSRTKTRLAEPAILLWLKVPKPSHVRGHFVMVVP